MAGSWVKPRNEVCATRSSCALMAALMRGMIVPVDVGPDGRVAVEVFVPVLVPQPAAFAAHQQQRLVLRRAPVAHRREGMPEVGFVEVGGMVGHRCGRDAVRINAKEPRSKEASDRDLTALELRPETAEDCADHENFHLVIAARPRQTSSS